MEPESVGLLRRYGWSVGVVISASAFFLVAFFVTGLFLDDGESAAAPLLANASAQPAPSDAAATADDAQGASDAAPAVVAATDAAPGAGPGTDFTTSELPSFDASALLYGGEGADGSILAGRGIVASSGFDRRTDWEIIVPSAQMRAAIARVGVTPDNFLGAPDNPEVIGWWEDGPAPGETGNVLLDGHRDFTDVNGNVGVGVCWLLTETSPGDAIIIRDRTDGSAFVYTVRQVFSVVWNDPSGAEFLRASDTAMLTLITCEGSFDSAASNYSQRRIVVADLTDSVAPSGSATGQ